MASPYMTKDRVRDTMLTIDSLAHYLEMFLESDGEDATESESGIPTPSMFLLREKPKCF